MSLPNSIDQLRRRIAEWMQRQQRLRRRKLNVVRLEERRLPDASFALIGDVLSTDGFDAGDSLNVEFDSPANELQLSLQNGQWDLADLVGPFTLSPDQKLLTIDLSLAAVNSLQIDASSNALANVTDSGSGLTLSQLTINGGGAVAFDNSGNNFGQISVSGDSLNLNDANDLEISHLDLTGSVSLTAGGVIGDTSGASINAGSQAYFEGTEIVLGDDALDSTEFGSLSFVATGSVSITEDGDMELSGSSSASELQLVSSGSITDQSDADLDVSGKAEFTAASISIGDDANNDTTAGTLTFQVTGAADFQIDGSVTLSGNSSAGSLTLDSELTIQDEATADLTVLGLADLSGTEITLGEDTDNDTEFGSLKFNASGPVTLLLDATVDLASGSQATDVLLDVQGDILATSAGGNTAISSSEIQLTASGAIGASSQSVRLNADHLQTTTTNGGDQFLAELDTVNVTTLNAGAGTVLLTSGTFRVSNTITAAQVSIGANARLGGTGTIAAAVTTVAGSTVSPGESPGILNSGNFELVGGSSLEIEIESPVAGIGYDQLNVTGTVTLGGTLDLVLDPLFIPASGTSFTIVNNDAADSVIGQFTGVTEGALVTVGGQQFLISYQGGDGNDVVLTAGVPIYDFDAASVQVVEGDSGSTIRSVTLTRSGNTSVASTVDVTISSGVGGTATPGVDFVERTVTVSFAAGETTQTIDVEIFGDEIVENNETLSLSISNFSAQGQAGTTQPGMQIVIEDDDVASITVSDISEQENGTFQFVLTLDRDSSRDITVTVNTADLLGEALAGLDYTAIINQTVTFSANGGVNQTQIVTVTVNNELMVESDQDFAINLSDARFNGASDPSRVGIADLQGIATIRNDDSATISIGNVTLDEGDGATTDFTFVVSLSAAVEDGLDVTFNTADGTATSIAGPFQDFLSQLGTLTFVGNSGEQQVITISVTAETWFESTETFEVQLGTVTTNDTAIDSAAFLSLAGTPATGTIVNDDTRVLARIVAGNLIITDEVQGGQANRISIELDGTDVLVSSANDLGTGSVVAFSELRFDFASITGQIQVSTRGGDDVLIVDFGGGSPIGNADLLFDGGSEIATDGLVVIGDGSNIATYSPSATIEGDGRIVVDGDGVTFVDLEPVDITGMAVVTVALANADDVIGIAHGVDYFQGGVNNALRITGMSGGVVIESAALWNNGHVIIDTRTSDGDDQVTIQNANNGHLNSSLTVRTGTGADSIQVDGNIALNNALHLQAAEIVLGMASITTGLTQRLEGATEIAASMVLTGSTVQFDGTVDSDAAGTNTLTVSGNVVFNGTVGTTSLASLHVTGTTRINASGITTSGSQDFDGDVIVDQNTLLTATSVNFGAAVDSASGELNDLNISGSAVFQGAVGSTDRLKTVSITGTSVEFLATADVGSGGISLTTTDFVQFSGAVSTTAGGEVLISNGGLLTLAAAADFTLDGRFAQTGAGLVRTGADIVTTGDAILFTSALTQLGGVLLNTTSASPAGSAITLASVNGSSQNLTLNAGSTGTISVATVSNSATLGIQNSGQSTFSGSVAATTLQIDDTTGAVVFNGTVNATSLTTANQPYAIEFNAGGTIVNAAVLVNSGGNTFGNDNADSLTFTGGLTSIVSTNTIRGTIITSGNDILLGTSSLVGRVTLQTSGGNITGGLTTGAAVPVTLNAGSGDISFTNAGNVFGNLVVTGHTVSLVENDDVTQNGEWLTTGNTTLIATNNDIILNGLGNVFGILNLTSSNAEITESADIQLGTSTLTNQLLLTTTGAVIDSLAGETANVTAADLTIMSVNGIGSTDSINTTVDTFSFTNTGVGNVRLVNTQSLTVGDSANLQDDIELCVTAGDLVVDGLLNAGTNTVRLQSDAGAVRESATGTITAGALGVRAETNITLATNSNNVQVLSAVSRTGSVLFNESNGFIVSSVTSGECFIATSGVVTSAGAITLNALTGTLQIDNGVTSGAGPVSITAATGTVHINALVSSTSGNIRVDGNTVTQDANVTTGLNGIVTVIADAGAITMADGAITSSNAGTVSYHASGNVALSILQSASGLLEVIAGGSISDVLASEGTGGENLRGIAAALTAATGIGASNDIDTAIDGLTAVNTTSGIVDLHESTALRLDTIDNGTRRVVLTTGGAITDDGDANIDLVAGTAVVTITGVGNLGTSSNRIETRVSDLSIHTAANSGSQFISELDQLSAINLNAGGGTVSLVAGGAIEDADAAVDLITRSVRLEAQGGIGSITTLSVDVENLAFRNLVSGAVQISNASDLRLSAVDGLASSNNSGGSVTLTAAGGIAFDVNATALGNVTANATESNVVNRDNVSIQAGVTVASTSGNILLRAGDRITISSTAVVQANTSGTQNITLTSGFADTDGDGRMTLDGSVLAGTSTGTITLNLNQTAGATQSSTGSLVSRNLRLLSSGSNGSFDLDQSSSNASAILAADTEGAVALQNSTALAIGTVSGTVGISTGQDNVTLCATSIDLQQDINAGTGIVRLMSTTGTVMQSNGSIIAASLGVRAATGINLTSSGNDANVFAASGGTGSVTYVDADGFAIGSVSAEGCFTPGVTGIQTTSDFETCVATGNIDITTVLNVSGTVRLEATTGRVAQTASGTITATNLAVRAAGDIDLNAVVNQISNVFAAISTVSGRVEFSDGGGFTVGSISAGSCVAAMTGVTSASGLIDLTSNSGNITSLNNITALGAGDVRITANTSGNVVLNGLTTAVGNGNVIIVTDDGAIDLNNVVSSSSGNILLSAGGSGNDLDADADIRSLTGHVTLVASDTIDLGVGVDISTGNNGTLHLDAVTGSVSMTASATLSTVNGGIRVQANQNITIGDITALSHVSLISAMGMVLDADPNDLDTDITAAGLRIEAFVGIGTLGADANAIETTVSTLAARAGMGGIHVLERNGLTVGDVSVVTQRVQSNGTTVSVTNTTLSDLVTTNGGSIVLQSQAGNLVLSDGTAAADGNAFVASGSGNVLIRTLSAVGDIVANSGIRGGGHISLIAGDDIDLNESLTALNSGTVVLRATNGTADASGTEVDGVNINGSITTSAGDILVLSSQAISQTAAISSTSGDVGLIASGSVTQTNTGDITTTTGDALVEAGTDWTMSGGTVITAGGGDFDGKAVAGEIALGQINSTRTALTAGSDIRDANGTTLNIVGTSLSLRAGGRIGNHHDGNNAPQVNTNAIDTQVSTLSAFAGDGIYIEQSNSLIIDTVAAVSVSVNGPEQVNFNSTTTAVPETRGTAVLEDLRTTNNGPIKIVTLNGSLTINDGVSSHGTGDLLLEARGAGSDVFVNAAISSGSGHVTLEAADSVRIGHDLVTRESGSIYVLARTGSITVNDANNNGVGIENAAGNVLLNAATQILLNARIRSSGSIGLQAGRDVLQDSDLDAGGDLLVIAARDIVMAGNAGGVAGGHELLYRAGRHLDLGTLAAAIVSLEATSGHITDARSDLTANVAATNLRMVAGSRIGDTDTPNPTEQNRNAVDTNVTYLAARAGGDIFVHEVAAGGNIVVQDVATVIINVGIRRANFNSSEDLVAATATLEGLADLTTTRNGSINLLASNGTIFIHDGLAGVEGGSTGRGISAAGTGNILLESRGSASDIVLTSDVVSAGGHITMNAGDDISLQADISTVGSGTVSLFAANGNSLGENGIDMRNGTSIITGGGNARLVADNESDLRVAHVNAGTGGVSLKAERSVLDSNASANNIQAVILRIEADAAVSNASDGNGIIGGSSVNSSADQNVNAIDTQVSFLAAQSADGIYLREANGLTITETGSISVQRLMFNGTAAVQTDFSLGDLTTTDNGVIKLQSTAGSIILNDGGDGDDTAISAHGTGDVLLQTLNVGDIVVNSQIRSGTGHVTLDSADDLTVNANLQTSGTGTVLLSARNSQFDAPQQETDGISIHATVNTLAGDVLLSTTGDIRITKTISSAGGDLGLIAGRDVEQSATGDILSTTGDVMVEAGRNWIMDSGAVIEAGGGEMSGRAIAGNLVLSVINSENVGLQAGADLIDANGLTRNINSQTLSLRAGGRIGSVTDSLDTRVTTLAAQSGTGIFLSEADSLTIDTVAAITVNIDTAIHVNFNSTTTAVPRAQTIQTLEDLSTIIDGSIHISSITGKLTVNGGTNTTGISAGGAGNIQLSASGSTSDIVLNAKLFSGTGDVLLDASRHVLQQDDGDVTTSAADVLIHAGQNWTMSRGTVISSVGGSVGGQAESGDVSLGSIRAETVALTAGGSVRDINLTDLNIESRSLSLVAGRSIGDDSSATTSPGATADPIDTQVDILAANAAGSISINQAGSLAIAEIAPRTIGGTRFDAVSGILTEDADIFLNVNGQLRLDREVHAGTSDIRLVTRGSVTQSSDGTITADKLGVRQESSAGGDITLFSRNDVNTSAFHNSHDGGTVSFHDVNDLFIRSVASQTVGQQVFSATDGITAEGGAIHIQTERHLTVLQSVTSLNGIEDNTSATGESIKLESVNGNISIDASGGAILISSDEAPGSNAVTGDRLTLTADSDKSNTGTTEGNVEILGNVILSTDGGVAKKFGQRPEVGKAGTAFFQFVVSPLPVAIDNSPAAWNAGNAYINAFSVLIGHEGEENLTVDVDWQDPSEEKDVFNDDDTQAIADGLKIYNKISSERIERFLVEKGGPATEPIKNNPNGQIIIGHLYTATDYTRFQQDQRRTTIDIDFSVSHHESIQLNAAWIKQDGPRQSVPGFVASSTDDKSTTSDRVPLVIKDNVVEDDIFENGVAQFKIPTVTPAPPAFFSGAAVPRVDRPFVVAPPETQAPFSIQITGEFGGGAVSGSVSSTKVFFEIRRQFEADAPAVAVVKDITDSSLISSREAFEEFVLKHPELQDGAGYEIWIISDTGGQKISRPIVEFEITGGQLGTVTEETSESAEPLELKVLEFQQPQEDPAVPVPDAEVPEEPNNEAPQAMLIPAVREAEWDASRRGDSRTTTALMEEISDENVIGEVVDTSLTESHPFAGTIEESEPVDENGDGNNGQMELTLGSGTVAGLAVTRFRQRQRDCESTERQYSRAARFVRRHS